MTSTATNILPPLREALAQLTNVPYENVGAVAERIGFAKGSLRYAIERLAELERLAGELEAEEEVITNGR